MVDASRLQLETLTCGPWSGWARPGVELDVTSLWTPFVVFLTARFFAFLIAAADCLAGLAAAAAATPSRRAPSAMATSPAHSAGMPARMFAARPSHVPISFPTASRRSGHYSP